ncbi:lysozyme C-1/C-2-like [Chiloscyllium punctatum]|uniref:lysozyme C-1/C-2-like n=1 Tax=Chiloscyllium punctatum TaxID=137246 RepID=UPI003B632070
MKILIVLSVLFTLSSAKVLSRCELAHIVKNSILVHFTEYKVADWVCLAYYASGYNTLAVQYERSCEGKIWSADYGIFQISSKQWCADAIFPNGTNECHMNCNLFLNKNSNLQTDIDCAAVIVNQQGMQAWPSWVDHCKGRWIDYFTFFCFW